MQTVLKNIFENIDQSYLNDSVVVTVAQVLHHDKHLQKEILELIAERTGKYWDTNRIIKISEKLIKNGSQASLASIFNMYKMSLSKQHRKQNIILDEIKAALPETDLKHYFTNYTVSNLKRFNDYRVSPEAEPDRYIDYKNLHGHFNIVKSPTGSGKTYLLRRIIEKAREDKLNIVSIVSRRVMASKHAADFKLLNYLNLKKKQAFYLDEDIVIQIDSIISKLKKVTDRPIKLDEDAPISNGYILILDELNSIIIHLLNNMDKFSKQRFIIIDSLIHLIRGADFAIGLDADITQYAIDFLHSVNINKNTHLYINDYQQVQNVPAQIYKHSGKFMTDIINSIKKGNKIYLCSDSKTLLDEDIIKRLIEIFEWKENVDYIFYSCDNEDIEINMDTWKDKHIFTSPKIIYGISYEEQKTHEIFGYYIYNNMTVDEVMQQCARIRDPIRLNIYYTESPDRFIYSTLDDVIKNHENINIRVCLSPSLSYIEDAFYTLFYTYELIKSEYSNLDKYIRERLAYKGYNKILYIADGKAYEKAEPITQESITTFEELTETQQENTKIRVYENKLCLTKFIACLETDNDAAQFLIYPSKYNDFTLYNKIRNMLSKDKKEQTANFEAFLKDNKDIAQKKYSTTDNKLCIMDKLHTLLKIKWFKVDYFNHVYKNENGKMKLEINEFLTALKSDLVHKSTFNIRSKLETYADYYKALITCYSSVFKCLVQKGIKLPSNKGQYGILKPEVLKAFKTLNGLTPDPIKCELIDDDDEERNNISTTCELIDDDEEETPKKTKKSKIIPKQVIKCELIESDDEEDQPERTKADISSLLLLFD